MQKILLLMLALKLLMSSELNSQANSQDYNLGNTKTQSSIELPYLEGSSKEARLFNEAIRSYSGSLLKEFYKEPSNHKSIDISYELVNTKPLYTVKLLITQSEGSSAQKLKFFHIYKHKLLYFHELFNLGYESVALNIKEQMQLRSNANNQYFLDFKLSPKQNFYFKNGYLVVCFDEYAVAPGHMGLIEFIIPKKISDYVLKEEFTKL